MPLLQRSRNYAQHAKAGKTCRLARHCVLQRPLSVHHQLRRAKTRACCFRLAPAATPFQREMRMALVARAAPGRWEITATLLNSALTLRTPPARFSTSTVPGQHLADKERGEAVSPSATHVVDGKVRADCLEPLDGAGCGLRAASCRGYTRSTCQRARSLLYDRSRRPGLLERLLPPAPPRQ